MSESRSRLLRSTGRLRGALAAVLLASGLLAAVRHRLTGVTELLFAGVDEG